MLRMAGEFDLQAGPAVASHLGVVDDGASEGVDRVCVDLGEITFSDSSGLHAIIKAEARAADAGLEFTIEDRVAR